MRQLDRDDRDKGVTDVDPRLSYARTPGLSLSSAPSAAATPPFGLPPFVTTVRDGERCGSRRVPLSQHPGASVHAAAPAPVECASETGRCSRAASTGRSCWAAEERYDYGVVTRPTGFAYSYGAPSRPFFIDRSRFVFKASWTSPCPS